jgi:hypothetical protein
LVATLINKNRWKKKGRIQWIPDVEMLDWYGRIGAAEGRGSNVEPKGDFQNSPIWVVNGPLRMLGVHFLSLHDSRYSGIKQLSNRTLTPTELN